MTSGVPNPSVRIAPITMRINGSIVPVFFLIPSSRVVSVSAPLSVPVSWPVASTTSKLIVGSGSLVSSPNTEGVGFFVGDFGDATGDVVDVTTGISVGTADGLSVFNGVGVLVGDGVFVGLGVFVGEGVLVGVGTSVGVNVGEGNGVPLLFELSLVGF